MKSRLAGMMMTVLQLLFLSCGVARGTQVFSISNPTFTDTYDGLGAFFGSNATCGGSPCALGPVVLNGQTYTTSAADLGYLRYLENDADCSTPGGSCIDTNSDLGFINIVFSSAVIEAGGFVENFGGPADVQFFAPDSTPLGTVSLGGVGFAGWEDVNTGIGSMRIIDAAANSTTLIFDDLQTAVPEPATIASMILGLSGLICAKIRWPTSRRVVRPASRQ